MKTDCSDGNESPRDSESHEPPDTTSSSSSSDPPDVLDLNSLNIPEVIDILISARFNGSLTEKQARELNVELNKGGIQSYIVCTAAGGDFGILTMRVLVKMKAMVVFGCDNYGAMTRSRVSSCYELRYANSWGILIIPIQLGKKWPPEPSPDINGIGLAQNKFILHKELNRLRWSSRKWDAAECAKEVIAAFRKRHRPGASDNVVVTRRTITVKIDETLTKLQKEHMRVNALDLQEIRANGARKMLEQGQVEACFVILPPPSTLSISPKLSKLVSEIYDTQDEYAKVLNMNSLFVDGSDEGMIDILKKELAFMAMAERSNQSTSTSGSNNFKTLKYFVLIGEGLPDDSWLLHPDAVSDETEHGCARICWI